MPDDSGGPRRAAALAGTVALFLAVSGCLGLDPGQRSASTADKSSTDPYSSAGPTTTSTPRPRRAPAPPVGVCHRLTYGDIGRFSNAGRRVACTAAHTSYTYAVNRLPRALTGALDSHAVQSAAQSSCQRAFGSFVGGSTTIRATTRLTPTYFLPRAQAFADGTRWVRCDVVALLEPGRLAGLPASVRGLLNSSTLAARYAVCSQGRPGDASSALVMCTQTHTYRAVTAILLGGPDVPLPTASQLAQPKATCRQLVGKLLGVDGGFSFVFTYPDRRQWNNGQRYGLCWNGQST